jgi:hypothetical protein
MPPGWEDTYIYDWDHQDTMTIFTWNFVRACDQPDKRMAIVKLLLDPDKTRPLESHGADIAGNGHVGTLHRIAQAGTTDCAIPILRAAFYHAEPGDLPDNLEFSISVGRTDAEGKEIWWDDSGHSPIDYSMSRLDPGTNNCVRLSREEAPDKYKFAEYAASLDKRFAKEFEQNKKNWKPGTTFPCSMAQNLNASNH